MMFTYSSFTGLIPINQITKAISIFCKRVKNILLNEFRTTKVSAKWKVYQADGIPAKPDDYLQKS